MRRACKQIVRAFNSDATSRFECGRYFIVLAPPSRASASQGEHCVQLARTSSGRGLMPSGYTGGIGKHSRRRLV
eukprot:6622626-Pyramimonas_sp.AAC.1